MIAQLRRSLWSGVLLGLGFVAFIDEAVFHQLLHWHHFYDKSTTGIGLASDGLFHAFSWLATIGGSFLYAHLRRIGELNRKAWLGGIWAGGGTFQLYDGTIQHKLMRLHQIRYVDEVYLYDWTWNVVAGVMIVVGLALFRRSGQEPRAAGSGAHGSS
ncbi:DUF2243 domain-containing protein [Cohnella sp. GCM10027633]|uniref:DUF2243 domain-containing protein n=1 Tax=unclassified Cohnella TaxID=2636738 RepID=UPI0036344F2F